jgi:transcriptional regulator with AAA-type ATPase domain
VEPKTYQDHFRDSGFTDKDLAIEAYRHAPAKYRQALETTIVQMSRLIGIAVKRAEEQLARNQIDMARTDLLTASRLLQALMEHASAIINGSESTMAQGEIDALLGP